MFGLIFSVLGTAISLWLPLYNSCKCLNDAHPEKLRYWVSYWCVYALYQRVRYTTPVSLVIAYIPFSSLAILYFQAWLVFPHSADMKLNLSAAVMQLLNGNWDLSAGENGAVYLMNEHVVPLTTNCAGTLRELKVQDWAVVQQAVVYYNWVIDKFLQGNPSLKMDNRQELQLPEFTKGWIRALSGYLFEREDYAVVNKDDVSDFKESETPAAVSSGVDKELSATSRRSSWFGWSSSRSGLATPNNTPIEPAVTSSATPEVGE